MSAFSLMSVPLAARTAASSVSRAPFSSFSLFISSELSAISADTAVVDGATEVSTGLNWGDYKYVCMRGVGVCECV